METLTPRQTQNRIKKELATIQQHQNQKPVKELVISIEWKKSRTWGYCPRANAKVFFQDGSFERKNGYYASGCGYDKESTVIASIFNDFLRYKLYQKRRLKTRINQEEVNHPYGVYYYEGKTIPPKDASEYYYRKPSYNGGVGTSCYTGDKGIGKFIGGHFENVANGDSFSVYKYTDGIGGRKS